jgi:DnaJ-class molecular chaperone
MPRKKPPVKSAKTAEPVECTTCKGLGEVSTTVRVGRRHRDVGQQSGFCLACLGTGTTTPN